jgi:Flp pilus assembly protein TadD
MKLVSLVLVTTALANCEPAASQAPAMTARSEDRSAEMSELAFRGKRLFDSQRWAEAEGVLDRVAKGESNDDGPTRQYAEYHRAICLYRLRAYDAAHRAFRRIALNPGHVKRVETLLWTSKLMRDIPDDPSIVDTLALYGEEDLRRFDNPEQQDLYWQIEFVLGRRAYRAGKYDEAVRHLARVHARSASHAEAESLRRAAQARLAQ